MSKEGVILYSTREAKCNENHYIDFLVATQKSYSCLEAVKTPEQVDKAFAHDALNRLLQRLQPSPHGGRYNTSDNFPAQKTIFQNSVTEPSG